MVVVRDLSKLVFSDTFSSNRPVVIQVDESWVEGSTGEIASIKFSKGGEAFLCHENATYTLRHVDNSNTQFFVKPVCDSENEIAFACQSIAQVTRIHTRCVPDKDIAEIFEERGKGADILSHVCQRTIWSEASIVEHLRLQDNYFIEEGEWVRMADEEFFALTDLFLGACAIIGSAASEKGDEGEFNSEDIWLSVNEALVESSAVSMCAVQYLLSRLSDSESEFFKNKGESQWPLKIPLSSDKIVVHRARQVLHDRFKGRATNVNVDVFLNEWKEVLSTTVLIDASELEQDRLTESLSRAIKGKAVIDKDLLIALDARNLSFQIDKRLEELFKVKAIWEKTELEQLITPLLAPELKVEAVLLRSCRLCGSSYSSRLQ